MKKLTNPILLQTTHFQLSDEQSELLKLEMAEIVESATPSKSTVNCRINAIHAGTTKNYHTFPLEELEKSVDKWTKPYGKPILKNHDITEEPLGRIREATVLKYSESDGVLSVVASIADQDTVQKIYDERYMTVSIGVASNNVSCSVCGINWFEDECDHFPGRKYVDEDNGDESLCTAVIRDIAPIELSFVNSPADANDERFAGVVTIGESTDFEFYSDLGEGVTKRRGRKSSEEKKLSDDLALALKEAHEDFLSLFKTEGEDSRVMDEETKTLESEVVEDTEDLEATEATEEEASVSEEEDAQEAEEVTEETEEEVVETNEEAEEAEKTDDISILDEYLSEEESEVSEEVASEEQSEELPTVEELQLKTQELEEELERLHNELRAQEDSAAEWFKRVRSLLSQHVVDLKVFLNKAPGTPIEELEAEEKAKSIQVLAEELKELRKEFKESDLSVEDVISPDGILENRSVIPEQPQIVETSSPSTEEVEDSLEDKEIINTLTKQWSQSRPYKERS